MIEKPGGALRRRFWHADAWAAARAEKPASWHTPDPENPWVGRLIAGFTLFGAAMDSFAAFAVCFALLVVFAHGGNLLRRVLMYWSIRRYGPWREMAPEMRAVLDNPTDLAARPDRFAPLPRGFTSTAEPGAAPRPQRIALPEAFVVTMLALIVLSGLVSDLV